MLESKIDGRLVLLGEENSGRDEMNLGGNPFALLQAASRGGQTQIIREYERELPSGQVVNARWKVEGDQELGLPGPSEELLYLVLLQLTREAADKTGSWPKRVNFSRYDLLTRLNWPLNGNSYNLLRECMIRLKGVSIVADNAFWDARTKTPFKTVSFNIISNFGIADEPKTKADSLNLPLSWFEWDSVVYESFLAGNIRSLALEFVLTLEVPASRRLFRLLDMLRKSTQPARSEVRLDLMDLRDRMAISSKFLYASKIKQAIELAIDELIDRNYLSHVEYVKQKKVETAIFYFQNTKGRAAASPIPAEIEKIPAKQQKTRENKENSDHIHQPVKMIEDSHVPDIRFDAIRCYNLFQSLPADEQTELMELAKKDVSPIWHDRIGVPDSPMSLGLWQIVAKKYPERF